MELNPIQMALIPHLKKDQYKALCDEAEELMSENVQLRKRVEYLELEIATHAPGGWQVH